MAHDHFHYNHQRFGHDIRRYWLVALVTFLSLVLGVYGSFDSGSVALLSDSLHMGIDLGSVIIAISVEYYLRKNPLLYQGEADRIRGRGGVISSILLFIAVALVIKTAVEKLIEPEEIHSGSMIVFAVIGLVGNAYSLWLMEGCKKHVTHTALTAHIISDLVQSVGVVVVSVLIYVTGWLMLDSLSSFVIAVFLLRISVKTFRISWKKL